LVGKRRGQNAVEIIVIMSVVLLVLFFIYEISQQRLTESQNQYRVSQAHLSVGALASAAREVYSEGAGAKRVVTVTIPEGNDASRTGVMNESVINIGLFIGSGTSDVNELADFRIVEGANFPKVPGTYQVSVTAYNGYVMIGDASYTLSPGTIALEMLSSDTETRTLNVTSFMSSSLNVTLTMGWSNPNTTADLNGSSALTFTLPAGASASANVNFASTNASLGTYLGNIYANASNGVNQTAYLVLQIVGAQLPPASPVSYILIDTFSDSGYTTAAGIFDPTETVDIHGSNFATSSLVTITVRNSTGAVIHTGSNTSNSSGGVVYYWNPGAVYPGLYNASMNDSTKLNSTTFNLTGCS